ncbi:hypothetical protein EYF80_068061 [Liparis tanakae]|uniref:Uncharacterized protein n=1 Tax=Liparis tanakae TaxID=230148 RepID=A0A4Z2DZG1_9TELE|nr:hypothetical protein EYF80_068061 [Liparis tanakae]
MRHNIIWYSRAHATTWSGGAEYRAGPEVENTPPGLLAALGGSRRSSLAPAVRDFSNCEARRAAAPRGAPGSAPGPRGTF